MQLSENFGLFDRITDPQALARTVERFRERSIVLPTFGQLADPTSIPPATREMVGSVDPDAPTPPYFGPLVQRPSRAGTPGARYVELTGE